MPLQPCRRHGKKRKEDGNHTHFPKKDNVNSKLLPTIEAHLPRPSSAASDISNAYDGIDSQLQSSQVSSTVLDSPFQVWNNLPNNSAIPASPHSTDWQNISSTVKDGKSFYKKSIDFA